MPLDHILLIGLIVAVITLFATQWMRIEVTVLLSLSALMLTGMLTPAEAFTGFANPATITIACMFVLSAGLARSGAMDLVRDALRQHAKGSQTRLILLLAIFVPPASAFINNTPVVVMLVPVLLELCRESGLKPSRVMIPLSFLAIFGGTCTLIGTNTNILVHELYREAGGPGFGMFSFTQLGIVYLIGGLIFLLTVGQKLLPERTSLSALLSRKQTSRFVTEVAVGPSSRHIGKPAGELFGEKTGVRLVEIVRGETILLPPAARTTALQSGDALIIDGAPKTLTQWMADTDIQLPTVIADDERVPVQSLELMMAEAVVLPRSPFIGRTVAELELNRRFGIKVLAVMRRGRHHRNQLRNLRLGPGDVLLVQSDDEGLLRLRETEAVLIVEGDERPNTLRQRATAVTIMASTVLVATLTPVPLAAAAMLGASAMILAKCLRFEQALAALDTSVLFILAGTIPLGMALESTGLAADVVSGLMGLTENAAPVVILSGFYLLTALATQLLSNQATAVLLVPIALRLAGESGFSPEPLLIAICFGASASFMTPIGYATNTIVMGPGGYRFMDYVRIGAPLTVITWLLATLLIPVFWPF
ncbi:MAG: SLC13 family permease [Opitutales bacterium]